MSAVHAPMLATARTPPQGRSFSTVSWQKRTPIRSALLYVPAVGRLGHLLGARKSAVYDRGSQDTEYDNDRD